MKPRRITPPAELPVTLHELKAHCVVDFDDDDVLLDSLLAAAVDHLDGYAGILGRCMVQQEWAVGLGAWSRCVTLPFADVGAVTVTYRDVAGTEQTVDEDDYELIDEASGPMVIFRRGFAAPALYDDAVFPVTVAFTAGFGGPDDVPYALKLGVMMLAAYWYEHREAAGDAAALPLAFRSLIAPYRRVGP